MASSADDYIEKLILAGAIEVAGIDSETGEFMYSFTEKIKEIDEELKQRMDDLFLDEVNQLWERGFLDMNVTESNPVVRLSSRALSQNDKDCLPQNLKETLEYIIRLLKL